MAPEPQIENHRPGTLVCVCVSVSHLNQDARSLWRRKRNVVHEAGYMSREREREKERERESERERDRERERERERGYHVIMGY